MTFSIKPLAIEHLMRTSGDETLILKLKAAEPASASAFEIVGQLMTKEDYHPPPGTPLYAFCTSSPVISDWRNWVHTTQTSTLWKELETLVQIFGSPNPHADHYIELCALRGTTDSCLTGKNTHAQ